MAGDRVRRLARLTEELDETGAPWSMGGPGDDLLLEEIDQALRPAVHERRVPTIGTFLDPRAAPETWSEGTGLTVVRIPVEPGEVAGSRRFADGLSSWLLRRSSGPDELLMFDRPAGSERDLVVMQEAMQAAVVQRHPSGAVRAVGDFGVLRWAGLSWHHEPPVRAWIDTLTTCGNAQDARVLRELLEFAVHDLGAAGIGALLILRHTVGDTELSSEDLHHSPPPLHIETPFHLAPLRQALAQVDGAAVFDRDGILRRLGVRLVPSASAEASVDALGGTRHTSGRRYSYDEPHATVVVVSEDGPVTVLRNGRIVGRSPVT